MEATFGTKALNIDELFNYFYGKGLPPDPTPSQVRARLIFLGRCHMEVEYERSVSQQENKGRCIGLWNNIRSMIGKELKVTEGINISICSEARITQV